MTDAPWPTRRWRWTAIFVGAYVTEEAVVDALANDVVPDGVTIRRLAAGEANVYNAVRGSVPPAA